MSRRLDVIIAWGLVVAIIFTGLAHGAIEPWSVAAFQILLILLLELWALRIVVQRRLRLLIPAATFPLLGLIALSLIQCISWAGADGSRASLSMDVGVTRRTALMLILMLGGFLLAANFWTRTARLKSFAWFLTIFGFAVSLFSLIQSFTWNESIYWLRPMPGLIAPYGPFPSHNLYAGYIELFIPMPIAIALSRTVSRPARLFCAFAAVIMSLSVIFSLSRGGMISLAGALLFIAVVSLRKTARQHRSERERWSEESEDGEPDGFEDSTRLPRWRRAPYPQAAVVVAIAGAIIVGLLWLGPDSVASRLTQGTLTGSDPQGQNFYASRGWIWTDTLKMFLANPITGVGLGAYESAFPLYTANDGLMIVRQAHNDYLQIIADAGVIGGLLAIWFIMAVFLEFARGLKAKDTWQRVVTLGAGAGIASLLVHSLFDFNLQIPSTALLFLVLAGIIGGVSELRNREEEENKRRGAVRQTRRDAVETLAARTAAPSLRLHLPAPLR